MKREITITQNKKRKGFTLVELVVVIAILAVLSVGAITGYSNVRVGADEAVAKANAAVIVNSLNTYNVLAGTPIKSLSSPSTVDVTKDLELNTPADLVNMDLSVSAGAELAAALGYVKYDTTAERWHVG